MSDDAEIVTVTEVTPHFDRSPDARAAVLGDRDTLREKVARALELGGVRWRYDGDIDAAADAVLDVFYPKGDE